MGSGAGGYVKITLQTMLSRCEPDKRRLHRVSQLSFTGAEIPTIGPPDNLANADPGPPPGPQPAGKLGLGGV